MWEKRVIYAVAARLTLREKIKSFHLTNSCRGHRTMSVNIILVDTKGHIEKDMHTQMRNHSAYIIIILLLWTLEVLTIFHVRASISGFNKLIPFMRILSLSYNLKLTWGKLYFIYSVHAPACILSTLNIENENTKYANFSYLYDEKLNLFVYITTIIIVILTVYD